MQEFDLDAALARQPGLLLVDEFAHTNIPGSRHPKRWQDIEELLAAGIDVWTTLNIQHLESLNDVIQKITQVRVRETVPDAVFEEADEIVLVDLPPDELLKRLAEGKVYVQDTAARAVENFFKPQNLTALRELALRRAAERIDADLIERMQAQAIEGPWAAGERILACVGPDPISPMIVRTAKRLADLMDAPWIVVTVERPGKAIATTRRAAGRRGAEARRVAGRRNQTAGRQRSAGGDPALREVRERHADRDRPLARRLLRRAVPALAAARAAPPRRGHRDPSGDRARANQSSLAAADAAARRIVAGACCLSSGRRWPSPPRWWSASCSAALTPLPNLSMVFLMAVLFSAVSFGMWPAIYASVLSFLAYNFFFIEPLYTFTVAQPHELLALVIFLAVAVMTRRWPGACASRRASPPAACAPRGGSTNSRAGFPAWPRSTTSPRGPRARSMPAWSGRPCVLLGADGDLTLRGRLAAGGRARSGQHERGALGLSATTSRPAPIRRRLPIVPWLFLPLRTPRGPIGVRRHRCARAVRSRSIPKRARCSTRWPNRPPRPSSAPRSRAIWCRRAPRPRPSACATRCWRPISHDFRTPLCLDPGLGDQPHRLWRQTRCRRAQRTCSSRSRRKPKVSTRWCATFSPSRGSMPAALELRRDWIDLREIVGPRRQRGPPARRNAEDRNADLPTTAPLIRADATLVEQAIGNVIGNAVAHTPKDTQVRIDARGDGIERRVAGHRRWPRHCPAELPRVFEKFVRGDTG